MRFFRKQTYTSSKETQQTSSALFSSKNPNPESASKITGSAQQSSSRRQKKPAINPQYAYELLMCETEFETCESVTQDLVAKMFELYKTGIEYYNFKQDKKEQYFRKKLEELTNHPSVLKVLHQQNESKDSFYKKKHFDRLVEVNTQKATSNLNELMQTAEENQKKATQMLSNNVNQQLDSINSRLKKRKNAKTTASFISESISDIGDSKSCLDGGEEYWQEKGVSGKNVMSTFTYTERDQQQV